MSKNVLVKNYDKLIFRILINVPPSSAGERK